MLCFRDTVSYCRIDQYNNIQKTIQVNILLSYFGTLRSEYQPYNDVLTSRIHAMSQFLLWQCGFRTTVVPISISQRCFCTCNRSLICYLDRCFLYMPSTSFINVVSFVFVFTIKQGRSTYNNTHMARQNILYYTNMQVILNGNKLFTVCSIQSVDLIIHYQHLYRRQILIHISIWCIMYTDLYDRFDVDKIVSHFCCLYLVNQLLHRVFQKTYQNLLV